MRRTETGLSWLLVVRRACSPGGMAAGNGAAAAAASRCCCKSLAVPRNSRLAPPSSHFVCRAGSTSSRSPCNAGWRCGCRCGCRLAAAGRRRPCRPIGAASAPIRPHCDPSFSRRRSQATQRVGAAASTFTHARMATALVQPAVGVLGLQRQCRIAFRAAPAPLRCGGLALGLPLPACFRLLAGALAACDRPHCPANHPWPQAHGRGAAGGGGGAAGQHCGSARRGQQRQLR